MSRVRRMPLSLVPNLAGVWSDQMHRKLAQKLSALVDGEYYLKVNPDVRSAGLDPAFHYVKYGWREGRDPSASFSTQAYLQAHPDLLREETNPLLHFLEAGTSDAPLGTDHNDDAAEIALVAGALDRDFYLRKYDLAEEEDAAAHYCRTGWRAGFDPSAAFSTSHYLSTNIDVRNSGVNPFWHYLIAGREEGRSPRHLGGWRYDVLARQQPLHRMKEGWVRREAPPVLMRAADVVKKVAKACAASQVLISIGHDDYRRSAGGVQLCIGLEARAVAEQNMDYLSLSPWQPLPTLADEGADPILDVVMNSTLLGHARMSQIVAAAEEMPWRARHMVIHHLMGHAPEQLMLFAQALQVRETFLWLHDNFTLCPSYALQRNDITFCDAPSPRSTACMVCLYGVARHGHQARIAELFSNLDIHLIAPSKVALDYWRSRTRLTPATTRVHPHMRLRRRSAGKVPDPAEACRIAFVGMPAPHKGWPVFQALQAALGPDPRYEFWHFSSDETTPEAHHVPVECSAERPGAMVEALRKHKIDLVIHWATCRETFSFSTHEALAAGAAVVTNAGSGNVAAVVRRQKGGQVLADEAALWNWVAADGLLLLAEEARARRLKQAVSLSFSRFTLDHVQAEACVS